MRRSTEMLQSAASPSRNKSPGPVPTQSSLEDVRWLVGPEAAELLDRSAADTGSLVALAERLQRQHSPQRAHLLLEQVELRRRASARFPDASRMFFSARLLEQATDLHVARHKARRFPLGTQVADLCCGIGGDLMALAERGPVTAVDKEPAAIVLAQANLRVFKRARNEHEFRVEDVGRFSVAPFAAWHLDPDRRASGRRTTRLHACEPGPETIERLLSEREEAAIKLAPATELPERWQQRAELEWVGRDRQCRQQIAWFGGLARSPGRRRATVLQAQEGAQAASFVGRPGIRPSVADRIGPYVFEPDAAVLAAGLQGALALEHGLAAVHPAAAYYTADDPLATPILQCFEVTDVLPFDRKRLRKLFHKRGVGRLEIKTRGLKERPEPVRRDLRLRGSGEAVLLLVRIGKRVTAIVARRF